MKKINGTQDSYLKSLLTMGKRMREFNANDSSILERLTTLPGVHSWYIQEGHEDLPTFSSMRALSVFSENIYV